MDLLSSVAIGFNTVLKTKAKLHFNMDLVLYVFYTLF